MTDDDIKARALMHGEDMVHTPTHHKQSALEILGHILHWSAVEYAKHLGWCGDFVLWVQLISDCGYNSERRLI